MPLRVLQDLPERLRLTAGLVPGAPRMHMVCAIAVVLLTSLGEVTYTYFNYDGFVAEVTAYDEEWQLFVDLDNDRSTGYAGFEVVVRYVDEEISVRAAEGELNHLGGWGSMYQDTTVTSQGATLHFYVPSGASDVRYTYEGYIDHAMAVNSGDRYGLWNSTLDFCPLDPYKLVPGDCGCGRRDSFGCGLITDLNRDRRLDLRDYQLKQLQGT